MKTKVKKTEKPELTDVNPQKVLAANPNLSFMQRDHICQRWCAALIQEPLTELVNIPSECPSVEITLNDGSKKTVQITSIVLCFDYANKLMELFNPGQIPLIKVQVKNTICRTSDPEFIKVVERAISAHIGSEVKMRVRIFDADSTHLYPADDESAWLVASHVLKMKGY